jgi:hypothetical protein
MRRDEVNALAKEMIDHGARVLTVEETYSLCSRLLALDAALDEIESMNRTGCEDMAAIARRALAGEES